ncbi:bifunctional diaminohydroxyphosphoribosylaminopyrimidine deaminase/5-amino-6-(5-phosphoribosylamino)uracil reductase RibD [Paeniclostridium sordellii]|uniref:bifunctional diaminohydroxyphosphoribosylaminopyrimidine deaminase/5-amino-6-(5-phosphoribosylamino)uracil reductase RibD n=1 Tax=Paraclostridium sordellii TaxID=1505 RepID=UPI0013FFF924|nr:bifunctional diaminohydroxyphosphoribosylaminopyrimidine deaminase/5-amino-6-(5-phosphoribosylamino)uracil reductase RibD [Paeniclostridium sordellii]MVO71710.1 bifunctional diaminohydroxyphosphoribosylaminopyrimidine deaminase/5-amino-6-(5-phosphoribosylamino)uracil reductase RibD [Paeniclostridium sordellii]
MDKHYMKIALDLAKLGKGKVNPNPLVGAVIVKDKKIIAKGYHEKYGEDHAEVNAFKNAKENVAGATMYVTLEPCSHYGKTPPCVDKIIDNKISRVVIGMMDPNKLVLGQGIKKLQDAGIEVEVGVLEEECKKLNEVFIKYIKNKKPFVVLKAAMSLDGKISTASGESKWITGNKSRSEVHKLRNDLSAIMVGVDTVIIDNPYLTCRIVDGRNPIRIIIDSKLRIPKDSNVLENTNDIKTIIATTEKAPKEKIDYLENLGVWVIKTKSKDEKVNLKELMIKLGELKIDSILLEGGSTLNYSALEVGIVDKVLVYIAPKIIGGVNSKTPVGGNGIEQLKDAFKIKDLNISMVSEDVLIQGYIGGEEN